MATEKKTVNKSIKWYDFCTIKNFRLSNLTKSNAMKFEFLRYIHIHQYN